ncbi:hypothetical protein K450DRAFT_39821 [Umbelopsis ramanniana AG]|uniref:SH3 domain-containing protein n=1 Tax=Umbelopsis ramanniana AG TaxID=1314678 RepID=A0AAD5EJB9_UMBRA|nr:uncharacterized protein K450DRAFT_39821 [Umbelopsis ramanniana AG]KAI8584344.1 hypothetical protein K450DRAFT_39821 [Umbelopsis ramanniana AG]
MWSTKYQVRAHSPYVSEHPMDLSFAEGDVIDVLGEENSDWLNGCTEDGRFGSFPKQYVSESQQSLTPQPNLRQGSAEYDMVAAKPVPPARPEARPAVPVSTRPTSHSTAAKAVPTPPPRHPPAMPKRPSNNKSAAQDIPEIGRYIPDNSQDIIDRLRSTTPVTTPDFTEPIYWEESDMAELDEYARACPPEYTHSVQDLAAYLTDPFPEPLHKIRAIFAWVTDNISYDVHSFLNHLRKSQEPQDVLKSRSSVCEGYARLTQALGEACRLPIRMITGYAKGAFLKPQKGMRVDDRGGHAWNCILLHGQYLMIDSTWGAGHLKAEGAPSFNKAFNPFFFLTDPTNFIYSHFPKDVNDQFLNPPFSESEFFDLPWTKETYHRHNLLLLSPKPRTSVMETNDDTLDIFIEVQGKGAASKVDKIGGQLKSKDGRAQPAIGQRAVGYKAEGRDVWWIHVVCSGSGEFELELFVYESAADNRVSAELPLF